MATQTASKKSAKSKASKADSTHPKYAEMIKSAIVDLQNKKGSSRVAILKYINQNYDIHQNFPDQTNQHLRQALKHGVETGALKQVKGIGAGGSFKLANSETKKKPAEIETTKKKLEGLKLTKGSAPKKTETPQAAAASKKPNKVNAAKSTPKKSNGQTSKKSNGHTPKKSTGQAAKKTQSAKKASNAKGGKKVQATKIAKK
uniref:H15 domain-containing protein n=1 Tax=Panagrolaimus sp. ES5 TaxID=591445 RepID=A0AC34GXH7_9BILA